MKERQHVVLDDAVAEKIRNSRLFRLRSKETFPGLVAALCGLLSALWWYVSGNTNNYDLLLCVVPAFISYWIAGWVVTHNDLDPLTSSFSLKRVAELAAEHPEVAAFVSDAMAKGNTLRVRDLRAAYRIEREAEALKPSEYEKWEAAEFAKVREELVSTYGPAAEKASGQATGV